MRIWRALKVLAPMLVLLLAALPGFGQVDYSTATLKGTVLDVQGGGVPLRALQGGLPPGRLPVALVGTGGR